MTHRHSRLPALCALVLGAVVFLFAQATPARAADRERIETFLEITGFDVALEGIAHSAESAPDMLGIDPEQFGADWRRLSREVFDQQNMHDMAVEILGATLDDEMLDHAVDFYESDLGRRLVEVENAAHSDPDNESQQESGADILAKLSESGQGDRLALFDRMIAAIDSTGAGLRAVQEIQIRFLLTASASGVVQLRMDEQGLRALLKEQEDELVKALRESGLANSAHVYRDFSDAEVTAYVEALEHPLMQKVYELLNAVQTEITANRFEVLAVRMADLHPGQDI